MKTKYEVNNFSIVNFLSKLNSFSFIYSLQMELKGQVEMPLVYGTSRIMDLVR
jgi:hypothetical protein